MKELRFRESNLVGFRELGHAVTNPGMEAIGLIRYQQPAAALQRSRCFAGRRPATIETVN